MRFWRRISPALLLALIPMSASAQWQTMPQIEAVDDYFDQAGNFSFSFLRHRNRGINWSYQTFFLNSIPLNSIIDNAPPFGAMGSLSSISTTSRTSNTLFFNVDEPLWSIAGAQFLTIDPASESRGGSATAAISNRTYSYRLSAGYALPDRNGWAVMADASRRWGRSLSIEGVASDAWGVALAASKQLNAENSLQITALYNPSQRLMPSSSTAEAFSLAQNNLYNPSWGLQNGRQRSVNVRQSNEPILMLNHIYEASSGLKITSGALLRFGENSYWGLNWQGAPNPRPDYYRYLPSAAKSEEEALEIAQLWKTDINSRQINFEKIHQINALANDRAKYILEERVTQPLMVVGSSRVAMKNFSAALTLSYEEARSFKRLNSLFGGGYWLDVDSFVEQDDDVKEKNQNNVLDPNRQIKQGDRFGYDYLISSFKATLNGAYAKQWGNFFLTAGAQFSLRTLQREGFYEKENFPLGGSYGASPSVVGVDFAVRVEGEYRLGTRLRAGVVVGFNSTAPTSRQQFISPHFRNALTPNIGNATTFALEGRAAFSSSTLRLNGSLYYYHTAGLSSVKNLYDDLQHAYLHYVTRNASVANYGLQGSAEILLIDPLWLNFAVSLQNNVYTNNPLFDAYKESTGRQLIDGERLIYKDLHLGGAPQTLGVVSLNYAPMGWTVRLSAVVFDGGYVALSPIRHTARAMMSAASAEALEAMSGQEKFSPGVSIDLFGGYTHRFGGGQSLGIYAGINNLLSNPNFIASGVESDRFFTSSGSLTPQPSRYYYALPINFFLNITCRF